MHPQHQLVLVGAGHAHARVLRHLANARLPDLRISLITPHAMAPYSGMIPGYLAGHFDWDECCVNFAHLCRMANATLLRGEVASLDCGSQQLQLQDGTTLSYDTLSINIGSTLYPASDGSVPLLPLRPLAALRAGWEAMQQQIRLLPSGSRWQIRVLGGGAAGVESILAAQYRLQQIAPHVTIDWSLLTRGQAILSGLAPGAIKRMLQLMQQRQIRLETGFAIDRVANGAVHAADGRSLPADAILWATGAQAQHWPQNSDLALNPQGFIRVDPYLRSCSHPAVFAAGDCCHWDGEAAASRDDGLPKAGVFAVRMGVVLSQNLQTHLQSRRPPHVQSPHVQSPHVQSPHVQPPHVQPPHVQPPHVQPPQLPKQPASSLQAYSPQRHYLVLIGTGAAHAVASRGRFSWQGGWVWRWKNRIDRRFLAQFNPKPGDNTT